MSTILDVEAVRARFEAKTKLGARRWHMTSRCIDWTAYRNPKGYGMFGIGNEVYLAHRIALWLAGIDIPNDLEPDHRCRNKACVNVAHLELVPHKVNVLRGNAPAAINARKTHCKRGHSLSGDNLYVAPGSG